MDTGFAEQRNFRWSLNGSQVGTSSTPPHAGEAYYTYTGLQPSTWYNLSVGIYNTQGSLLASFSTTGETAAPPRPSNWVWTTAETTAFSSHGYTNVLTYLRWNSFIDRVSSFRLYKGYTAVSSSAYMTSNDKVLTATRFNLVRTAIGELSSTGITDRVKGDLVLGNYFLILQSSLNNIT